MDVQTFRAASLQEALKQVRESLGADASVLNTRELRRNRLGLFSKSVFEVEACSDVPVVSRFEQRVANIGQTSDDLSNGDLSKAKHASEEPAGGLDLTNEPQISGPASPSTTQFAEPRPSKRASVPLSGAVIDTMSELLEIGVPARLAKELIEEAAERCDPLQREDPWLLRASLNQTVARRLNVSGSIELVPNEQQVVALVGSTGVGKTTTLAKIAAGFRFDLGCQVGLITLDTFRLGAVDQLLQYAELISAPLEVVSSPEQVTPALTRLRECDLVLLDTAGRAPRDTAQLRLLQHFLQSAEPDATHLVVSASSSHRHLQDTLEHFEMVQPTNLLITKLDEATDLGSWLPTLCQSSLPVGYLTTGQHVPQDIVVASARRLARNLLGNPHHEEETRQPTSHPQATRHAS